MGLPVRVHETELRSHACGDLRKDQQQQQLAHRACDTRQQCGGVFAEERLRVIWGAIAASSGRSDSAPELRVVLGLTRDEAGVQQGRRAEAGQRGCDQRGRDADDRPGVVAPDVRRDEAEEDACAAAQGGEELPPAGMGAARRQCTDDALGLRGWQCAVATPWPWRGLGVACALYACMCEGAGLLIYCHYQILPVIHEAWRETPPASKRGFLVSAELPVRTCRSEDEGQGGQNALPVRPCGTARARITPAFRWHSMPGAAIVGRGAAAPRMLLCCSGGAHASGSCSMLQCSRERESTSHPGRCARAGTNSAAPCSCPSPCAPAAPGAPPAAAWQPPCQARSAVKAVRSQLQALVELRVFLCLVLRRQPLAGHLGMGASTLRRCEHSILPAWPAGIRPWHACGKAAGFSLR